MANARDAGPPVYGYVPDAVSLAGVLEYRWTRLGIFIAPRLAYSMLGIEVQ
jgi:hypothetical protein